MAAASSDSSSASVHSSASSDSPTMRRAAVRRSFSSIAIAIIPRRTMIDSWCRPRFMSTLARFASALAAPVPRPRPFEPGRANGRALRGCRRCPRRSSRDSRLPWLYSAWARTSSVEPRSATCIWSTTLPKLVDPVGVAEGTAQHAHGGHLGVDVTELTRAARRPPAGRRSAGRASARPAPPAPHPAGSRPAPRPAGVISSACSPRTSACSGEPSSVARSAA